MPMPRRTGFVISPSMIPQNISKCVVVTHNLELDPSDKSEDGFESITDAMTELRFPRGDNQAMEDLVESHPMYAAAKKEYLDLLNVFLPGFEFQEDSKPEKDMATSQEEDPELTDALKTFTALTKRRKEKAQEFYTMLSQFLEEYEKAVDELTSISADPVLKGSYLHEKISELKSTVKRKYGAKVQELQKECINKRRRANLPSAAKEIFGQWFADHIESPYPSDMEKQHLAQIAGVAEAQVSNWFVNVRKRYWKGR